MKVINCKRKDDVIKRVILKKSLESAVFNFPGLIISTINPDSDSIEVMFPSGVTETEVKNWKVQQ